MLSGLKAIVDLIRSALAEFRMFKDAQERKKIVLDLLRTYFLLKDCVDDGEKLLMIAGSDPISKIQSMDSGEAIKTVKEWDYILKKQGLRLYLLQGLIYGQDFLVVINPDLQREISDIVGYKMDRTVSLHLIGATLFFRNIFPQQETDDTKAHLISLMLASRTDGVLDIEKCASEIADVRKALDEYRSVVERFVSNEDLLAWSEIARQDADRVG